MGIVIKNNSQKLACMILFFSMLSTVVCSWASEGKDDLGKFKWTREEDDTTTITEKIKYIDGPFKGLEIIEKRFQHVNSTYKKAVFPSGITMSQYINNEKRQYEVCVKDNNGKQLKLVEVTCFIKGLGIKGQEKTDTTIDENGFDFDINQMPFIPNNKKLFPFASGKDRLAAFVKQYGYTTEIALPKEQNKPETTLAKKCNKHRNYSINLGFVGIAGIVIFSGIVFLWHHLLKK